MIEMKVKILNPKVAKNKLKYATDGSAAFDLQASIPEQVKIQPNQTMLIPSGIAIFIQSNDVAGLVIPRSGKSLKNLVIANSPGLIDSDFQGQINIVAHNNGNSDIIIEPLSRIAQLMFISIIKPDFEIVTEFIEVTSRGTNGFGHSGD